MPFLKPKAYHPVCVVRLLFGCFTQQAISDALERRRAPPVQLTRVEEFFQV